MFFVLQLCFIAAMGNNPLRNQKSIPVRDSSVVEVRRLDNQAIARFRSQQDFNYGRSYQSADSLWARFWRGFWHLLESIFSNKIPNTAVKIISLSGLAILFILIILKFSGISIYQLISKTPVALTYSNSEPGDNIHEINFDEEISKAMRVEQYRLAVRLLYLKALKQLSDSRMIIWSMEKTNLEYVQELNHPQHRHDFQILTQNFEYIWYGEFNLNYTAFMEIREEYRQFNQMLIERS